MRHFFVNRPIRQRVLLLTLTVSGVALVVAFVIQASLELSLFRLNFMKDVEQVSAIVVRNSHEALLANDAPRMHQLLKSLEAKPVVMSASILRSDGSLLAYYDHGLTSEARSEGDARSFQESLNQFLLVQTPVVHEEVNIGTLRLWVAYQQEFRKLLRMRLIIFAGILVIAFLLSFKLSQKLRHTILTPITDLVGVAQRIAADKDYTVRAERAYKDEVGDFVDVFNEMLAQIEFRDAGLQEAKAMLEERVIQRTALLESLQRQTSLILDSAGEGIYGTDRNGRLSFVNATAARLIRVSVEDLKGQPADITFRFNQPLGIKGPSDHSAHREGLMRRRDGSTFDVEYVQTPILQEGEVIGSVVVFRDISEKKKAQTELESMHRKLRAASRKAGMAEVASGVLHNVGNVLNSVSVSTGLIQDRVSQSRQANLQKALEMVDEHREDLPRFLSQDPKGKLLPGYLVDLGRYLAEEHEALAGETKRLAKHVDHVTRIINQQQDYATTSSALAESISLKELMDDALELQASSLKEQGIQVHRHYHSSNPALADGHKVLQILTNLLKNAQSALDSNDPGDRIIEIELKHSPGGNLQLSVTDNGIGITSENLTRIFAFGFTTRSDGHGFGLHAGALAAKEMGGRLSALSHGLGKGSTFILELPPALPEPTT